MTITKDEAAKMVLDAKWVGAVDIDEVVLETTSGERFNIYWDRDVAIRTPA